MAKPFPTKMQIFFLFKSLLRLRMALDINNFHRECDGKFATKGNGKESRANEYKGLEDVLGEEFPGLKGHDAIQKLMQEKRGHVKAAFSRPDIGDIDLAWGDDTFGIQHILKERRNRGQDTAKLLKNLASVIELGDARLNKEFKYEIRYKGWMAIVAPEFREREITMVISAFKRDK